MPSHRIDILLCWPQDGLRLFESMIPIGIASIAATLQEAGFSVKIIDFNHYTRDFQRELRQLNPTIVGIGGTTPTRKSSFKIASLVKKNCPKAVTVYGGPHATFAGVDTLEHITAIDYILKGEAELSMRAMAQAVINKSGAIEEIPGLVYRKGQEILETPIERIDDLSQLPIPDRSIFEHDYPLTLDLVDLPADYIMTSRGCPAACNFCSAARMFKGGIRLRSMDSVQEEINTLLQAKPHLKGLKIFDSTFTADRNHVIAFCDMIKPYGLKWESEIRADTIDRELMQIMADAGCVYINMGLETTQERLLKHMAKKIDVQQVMDVLEWCREFDIKTKVFFTFGHLEETYEECLEDIKFMNTVKERVDFYATTVGMRLYPGTTLMKQAQKRGYVPADFSWAKFNAPLSNYFVLEPSDVPILSQPQLRTWKMGFLIAKLFMQGTVLSRKYIKKMIIENTLIIGTVLKIACRKLGQILIRRGLKIIGKW